MKSQHGVWHISPRWPQCTECSVVLFSSRYAFNIAKKGTCNCRYIYHQIKTYNLSILKQIKIIRKQKAPTAKHQICILS